MNIYSMLLLSLVLTSCSTLTLEQYKEKYSPPIDIKLKQDYKNAYKTIINVMPTCYTVEHSENITLEVDHKLEESKNLAHVYYIVKNNPFYPDQIIYYVELHKIRDDESLAKVYAKGDIFRSTKSFIKNIQAWTSGDSKKCFK